MDAAGQGNGHRERLIAAARALWVLNHGPQVAPIRLVMVSEGGELVRLRIPVPECPRVGPASTPPAPASPGDRPDDLTPTQQAILDALIGAPPLTAKQLAARAGLHLNSHYYASLKALVDAGAVAKRKGLYALTGAIG